MPSARNLTHHRAIPYPSGSRLRLGDVDRLCSLLPRFRRLAIPVGRDVVLVVSGPVYILSGSVKRREHLVELGLERREVGFESGSGLFASVGGREVSFCFTFLETMVHRCAFLDGMYTRRPITVGSDKMGVSGQEGSR